MGFITGNKSKIYTESVTYKNSTSEYLLNRMGESINYLIDAKGGITSVPFTSSGSWTVPDGVTRVLVEGCGGGAGGSGGDDTNDANGWQGGRGGAGALKQYYMVGVTPGDTYSVTIGAGGAGGAYQNAGAAGGYSYFHGYYFWGAPSTPIARTWTTPVEKYWLRDAQFIATAGGYYDATNTTVVHGQRSESSDPAVYGQTAASGNGGGGGGSGSYGRGGHGAIGGGSNAENAASNSYGAGGGGGSSVAFANRAGGNGASGIVIIYYW